MSVEVPLRPHHLYHVAMEIAGWNENGMAKALVERVNKYVQPHQIDYHNSYYQDLIGRLPDRPSDISVFSIGLEKEWLERNKIAMSTYLNLDSSDSIRLISSGKDLMCRACYFGDHCVEPGSDEYEQERIFAINAKIENLYIGAMKIVNPHDSKNCYAIVGFNVIKTLIDMAINFSKDLEPGVIRGRESTLRGFLYNQALYI